MLDRRRWLYLCACAPAVGQTSRRCRVVFHATEGLTFTDFSATGQFALAAGTDWRRKTDKQVLVSTNNGGLDWRTHTIPEKCISLFARDKSSIWLVASSGLWYSADEGQSWKLRQSVKGLLKTYFLTEQVGFAVGAFKTVLRTQNGGADWTPVGEAGMLDTNPAFTTFEWVDFVSPRVGIILGTFRPPRKGNTSAAPFWLDPRKRSRRVEWPATSITLETRDGGASWKSSKTSLFGRITRMRYAPDGRGLALVEFHDRFEWPSEVFLVNSASGSSDRVFRRKDRAVTDLLMFRGGASILGAVEPPADPARAPAGIMRLIGSPDGKNWTDIQIAGQIPAGKVWLAAAEADAIWAASDSGYVLRCQ
jgi:hypothetical protein